VVAARAQNCYVLSASRRGCRLLPLMETALAKDDSQELLGIVEPIVRARIRSGKVVDVLLRRDLDHDGDPVILVDVIFDNPQERLDPKETVSLSRDVWEELLDRDVKGFPIMSFTAQSDLRNSAAA
jgi:hypothetical protein